MSVCKWRALPGVNAAAVGLIVAAVFQLGMKVHSNSPIPDASICIGELLFPFPPAPPPPLPREPFYNGYSFWLATLDRKDVPCTITVLCYFQFRAEGSLDQSKASHAPWLASQSCHSEQAPVMSWQSDTHCNTSVTLSITSLNTQYTYTYIWISGSINIYIWMYLQLHWFIIYVYNYNSYVTRGTSATYVYMYNHSTADTLLFLFRPFYV